MSRILIATDFSAAAENATHFGCRLARDFDMPVTLLHCFMIPITFNDNPMPVVPLDEGREMVETRLQEQIATLRQQYAGMEIEGVVMYGDVVDGIAEYSEEKNVWISVLGNTGEGTTDLWMGSSVVSALREVDGNVLAVPEHIEYRKPEKICFACDFKDVAGHFQLQKLTELVRRTGAQLHVVNVDHENKNYTPDNMLETTELHAELEAAKPVYHYIESRDVDDAIQNFITENHMDWLVIAPHKHSFFGSLFHKSHTKAMVKMSRIPIMALHEHE